MSNANDYDLIVIGGGPGGYSAAIRGSQLGLKTALVEKADLGGVCLNWGCIPTKALLHCAELLHDIRLANRYGIDASVNTVDIGAMVAHSRETAERLSKGVAYLMQKNSIDVLQGHGVVKERGVLHVTLANGNSKDFRSPHIVIATGARLRLLPGLDASDDCIWTAREAMVPTKIPASLVIIGAGAIGVEFASFYADLGAKVTLVEGADRILPTEDEEISARMAKALSSRGIECLTQTLFDGVVTAEGEATVTVRQGDKRQILTCERLLIAVGVEANTQDLGLEQLGVALDRGFIKTNVHGATNLAGLYAIGDVAGAPWLAHKAVHEGVACVENIAGLHSKPAGERLVPGCIYARPQVASIGMTESAARESGRPVKIGRHDLQANGKALASGHGNGLVKVILDDVTGEILGAHMIGHGVSEQIQGYAIAMGGEITAHEFEEVIFPHPTQSEAMHEALLDASGIAINQ